MNFKKIVTERYAAKKFDGKLINSKKVDELFELIRLAPSSYNLQPWKIKVITDQKIKEQLKPASWNQEQITTCSHLLVFCANTDVMGNIDRMDHLVRAKGMPEEGRKSYIQMMRDAFKDSDQKENLSWAQRQVYLALENALLGAKALGFDSCPMEGFDAAQYAEILKLPQNLVPTVLCPIGYAADQPRPKTRFPKEDIFF